MKNKKRIVSILLTLICIVGFAFTVTAANYGRNQSFSGQLSIDLDRSYRPTGSATYMFGIDNINSGAPINIELGMYVGSNVIRTRVYTSRGSTSRYYTLAGPAYVNFSGTNYNASAANVHLVWSYNY